MDSIKKTNENEKQGSRETATEDTIARFRALLRDTDSNLPPSTVCSLIRECCSYIDLSAEPIDSLDRFLLRLINALLQRRLRRRTVAGLEEGASWRNGHVDPALLKSLWSRQLCLLVFSVGIAGMIFGSWSVMWCDRCEQT